MSKRNPDQNSDDCPLPCLSLLLRSARKIPRTRAVASRQLFLSTTTAEAATTATTTTATIVATATTCPSSSTASVWGAFERRENEPLRIFSSLAGNNKGGNSNSNSNISHGGSNSAAGAFEAASSSFGQSKQYQRGEDDCSENRESSGFSFSTGQTINKGEMG